MRHMFFGLYYFFALLAPIQLISNAALAETEWSKRQIYWDHVKALPIRDGSCPEQLKAIEEQYGHPPLIAVGDSLYNGVQSLRINWWLAEWSAPVSVAIRLDLIKEHYSDRKGRRTFYVPQYPGHGGSADEVQKHNYGFDLEHVPSSTIPIIGNLIAMSELTEEIARQGDALRHLYTEYIPPNRRVVVDNIAFSGANSIDLVDWKIGEFKKYADIYTSRLTNSVTDIFSLNTAIKNLSSAFFFANAYFVLNPTKNKCLDRLTVLDLIKLRKPQRVILNVGANNGLWMLAFDAAKLADNPCDPSDRQLNRKGRTRCISPISKFTRARLHRDLKIIIKALSTVDGLDHVYINGLGKPTQAGNLVPLQASERTLCLGPALFYADKCISMRTAQVQDEFIEKTNQETEELLKTANKTVGKPIFHYVDVAKTLARFDTKRCFWDRRNCGHPLHLTPAQGLPVGVARHFDNWPLSLKDQDGSEGVVGTFPDVLRGGLFSYDNMHLSSIGYEVMAKAVLDAMNENGNESPLRPDKCKGRGEPGFEDVQPGDCIGLLVHPGWSYLDRTRRDFMLLRIAGTEQQERVDRFSALVTFARRLFGGN